MHTTVWKMLMPRPLQHGGQVQYTLMAAWVVLGEDPAMPKQSSSFGTGKQVTVDQWTAWSELLTRIHSRLKRNIYSQRQPVNRYILNMQTSHQNFCLTRILHQQCSSTFYASQENTSHSAARSPNLYEKLCAMQAKNLASAAGSCFFLNFHEYFGDRKSVV